MQGLPGTHAVNNWGPVIWLHSQNICNNENILLMPRLGYQSYTVYEGKQIFDINIGKYPNKTRWEIWWKEDGIFTWEDGIFTYKSSKLIFSIPIHTIIDFINLHSYPHIHRSTKISEAKWSSQDHSCWTQRTRDASYWFPHHIHWCSFWLVTMNCFLNISVILWESQQLLWNVFFLQNLASLVPINPTQSSCS